jgi:hypothetical protein
VTPEGGVVGRFGKPGVFGFVVCTGFIVVALTVGEKIDASETIMRIANVVAKIFSIDLDLDILFFFS